MKRFLGEEMAVSEFFTRLLEPSVVGGALSCHFGLAVITVVGKPAGLSAPSLSPAALPRLRETHSQKLNAYTSF